MKNRSKLYRGYQTVIPSNIRKEIDISLDDELKWNIEKDYLIVKIVKPKTLDDYTEFLI